MQRAGLISPYQPVQACPGGAYLKASKHSLSVEIQRQTMFRRRIFITDSTRAGGRTVQWLVEWPSCAAFSTQKRIATHRRKEKDKVKKIEKRETERRLKEKKKEEEEEGKEKNRAYTCSTRSSRIRGRVRANTDADPRARVLPLSTRSGKHACAPVCTRTYARARFGTERIKPRDWWGERRWMGVGARHGPVVGRTAHVLHPLVPSFPTATWAHISSVLPCSPFPPEPAVPVSFLCCVTSLQPPPPPLASSSPYFVFFFGTLLSSSVAPPLLPTRLSYVQASLAPQRELRSLDQLFFLPVTVQISIPETPVTRWGYGPFLRAPSVSHARTNFWGSF